MQQAIPNTPRQKNSKCIKTETDIKTVEATRELLKPQFIEYIKEQYIKEMNMGCSKYDEQTLVELLTHVNKNTNSWAPTLLRQTWTYFMSHPT